MSDALPVIIAGAGPGGTAAAMQLHAAGRPVIAVERGDEQSALARNIFLRPQAREQLLKLTGTKYGRDATIMGLVNELRTTAKSRGVDIRYHQRVTNVVDVGDHVDVTIQSVGPDGKVGAEQTIAGSAFLDASGGRVEAINHGPLTRRTLGKGHYYVTAQYSTPAPTSRAFGAFDKRLDRSFICYPIGDGTKGFVAYYDYAPGVVPDAKQAVADYGKLVDKLGYGTPITSVQGFNAQEHTSDAAVGGNVIRIGDSAANADPYIGAGFAAALIDARNAVEYLVGSDHSARRASSLSADILDGHAHLIRTADFIVRTRANPALFSRMLPNIDFEDPAVTGKSIPPSNLFTVLSRAFTAQRVHERWHPLRHHN